MPDSALNAGPGKTGKPPSVAFGPRTERRRPLAHHLSPPALVGSLGRRLALAVIGAALASSLLPASASAATFVGISGDNLVSFSSSRPDIVRSRPLRGLPDSDAIVGIDRRPANGQIYGLGISSRIYTISRTGSVTAVGTGPFTPALFGGSFGFDFNPMADRAFTVVG
jgi:hypothetical protein